MKLSWLFIFIAVCMLIQQCAKQTAPTGGPKDEIPPVMIRSNPEHNAVNFKGEEIQLTFDEFIQLNNPREQIIITPSIGKKFEVTARKNKVTLVFNSELQINTTYNFNFRESVQDLTEKNPTRVKLAFSTGPYIDSLVIAGTVKDILLDNTPNNYTVALTPATDTFNIFKHTASWITVTDKKGKFSLENLKPGKYIIYAFDDKNRNLVVDSKSEKFGFKSEPINLEGAIDSVKLDVYKLDASKLKLIASRPVFAYYNIRFSKSLVEYSLTPVQPENKLLSQLESDLSSIKVYNTIPDLDSVQVRLQAQDSINNKVDTLIYVKFLKKISTKDKFTSKVEFSNLYESKSQYGSIITFTKPVVGFNADSIYIQVDSINRISFNKDDYQWNENFTTLTINKKIEPRLQTEVPEKKNENVKSPKSILQFILTKGSAISVENDTAAQIIAPLRIIKLEDYGMISSNVNTKEDFILQLIDKSNKLIDEIRSKTHTFENVPPGNYYLRLIIDLNKNGKWDAGNYFTKVQPEPIIYYTNPKGGKTIFLKANWQLEDLLITF